MHTYDIYVTYKIIMRKKRNFVDSEQQGVIC